MAIYCALLHHPVRNRRAETVTTSVTNIDIHDLARTSRTYGLRGTFLVTPVTEQRALVARIASHWREGEGAHFNPVRAEAFRLVRTATDLAEVTDVIAAETGGPPLTAVTSARFTDDPSGLPPQVPYGEMRQRLATDSGALLVLFGTGWGLTDDLVASCDLALPPIEAVPGRDGYNHLPVRAAVAIVLDRLLGADRD